ncbi:MAG: flagellar motor switch protein FliN [Pseudomonadota bacterium]
MARPDRNLALLAGVAVRVSVEVGSASMRLADLLNMTEGSVVELDRQANDLLDIMANGTLIAKGEIVTVDGRYGVRVVDVVTPDHAGNGIDRRS